AKYLGTEVNSLIAKIDEKELENLTIPVAANIAGNYASPEVTTDLTSGVKNLTTKLIDIQKQKLINKGKDKAGALLGDILTAKTTDKDSTTVPQQEQTNDAVKDVLGGIISGNKQAQDSVAQDKDTSSTVKKDPVKDAAKSILGGLLGNKKKRDTSKTENDSIN
ncbi:MAG: AsmA family protein, partial [Maribacter sp.]|nr:AsmA family protein [Maribacter sp.]